MAYPIRSVNFHSTCKYTYLKVGLLPSKTVGFICFNRRPLKIMNAFYIVSKATFVLKIFKFLSRFFDYVGKQLDKKIKVNFKQSEWNVIQFDFIAHPSGGPSEYIKTKVLTIYLKKTKRSLELVSLTHFLRDFRRKILFILHFFNWPNLIAWLIAFTSWVIGQYTYCNYLLLSLWRHKFWI